MPDDSGIQDTTPELTEEPGSVKAPVAEAPVAEAPVAEAPSPLPSAPLAPDLALRAELEDAKRQVAEHQKEIEGYKAASSQFEEWRRAQQIDAYVKVLQVQRPNWDEETARDFANVQYEAWVNKQRVEQAEPNAKKQYQAQVFEALDLAQKYGVSAQKLLELTPSEMRARAESMGRIIALERQVADLTKNTVPPQSYEAGQGGGGSSRQKRLETLLGKSHLTDAEVVELGRL